MIFDEVLDEFVIDRDVFAESQKYYLNKTGEDCWAERSLKSALRDGKPTVETLE